MFFLIPVGVEGATLSRLPWVSIGLAGACVAAFLATWVLPSDPEHFADREILEVLKYWNAHPHAEPPRTFQERFLTGSSKLGDAVAQWRAEAARPSDAELALQQAELDALVRRAQETADGNALYHWSLVPDRGKLQPGWLTGLFLHFGWVHLLGNLLFFYMVGPLLEEAWGRLRFLAFYLGGGILAFAAQVAFQPTGMMLGASGAIAACMGAFTLIYARQKVRMGYLVLVFLRPYTGTFPLPAWLWGLGWVAFEVFDLAIGASTNVAVMAHVAGFGFGLAVAGTIHLVGPRAEGSAEADVQHAAAPGPTQLGHAHRDAAARDFRRALSEDPNDAEALFGMVRVDLEAGRRQAATYRLDRLVAMLAGDGRAERAAAMLTDLGPAFDPTCLTPATAGQLADALEPQVASHHLLVEQLLEIAGRQRDNSGAKALIRAAELRLERRDSSDRALQLLSKVRGFGEVHPSLLAKLVALEARAAAFAQPLAQPPESLAAPVGAPLRSTTPAAPLVHPCRLIAIASDGITLESGGKTTALALTKILAVAASAVTGPDSAQGALYTDLVVSWGGNGTGPVVLRLDVPSLNLGLHFPQVPTRLAYSRVLALLLQRGARPLPDLQSLQAGAFRTYPDTAALDEALYGPW